MTTTIGPVTAGGTTPEASPSRVARVLAHRGFQPGLVALLGFTISVIGITTPSIWYDESATIISTTRSWPQLWAMLDNVDAVHGLYYIGMHLVFDLVGYSPLTLRLPSAFAVAGTAALIVVLGRQLGRPRLAFLAGIVFCFIPRVTWMGTEGRSYALTALAAVLLTVVFVWAQRSAGQRAWLLYAGVAFLSSVLFIYLALVVVAHGATVLWMRARRHPGSGATARRWVVAAAVAAVAALPIAREVVSQSGQLSWIHELSSSTFRQVFRTQWFMGSEEFAIAAGILIVIGVVALRRDRRLLALVLPALVVPTLALLAYSVVASPIYQPRYLSMCTPFLAIAIAAGVDAFRGRLLHVGVISVIVALAIPQIVAQRQPEAKENASWSQIAELIDSERTALGPNVTTGIIYGNVQRHPTATARVMAYSYPDAYEGTVDITLRTPAAETAQLWETRAPITASTDRLRDVDVAYLITSNARDLQPITTNVLDSVGWQIAESWEFTSVQVVKYERR